MDKFLAFFGLVRKSRFDKLQCYSIILCNEWRNYKEQVDNFIDVHVIQDVPIEPKTKVENNVIHIENFNKKT